jgi:hypothetical protein
MPELDFTIRTIPELAGAEATARNLEMQIGQAKVLGKDYSEMQAQLTRVRTSMENLTPEVRKATEAGEGFHANQREVGHVLREFGEQIAPGAARTLYDLRFGFFGLALAAGEAAMAFREHLSAMNKDMDEMADRAAQAFADMKANLFDAIRNEEFSTDSVDKYFDHLQKAIDAGKTAIAQQQAMADAQLSATERIQKAQEALALARVKANPDLNPQQKEIEEARIKQHYAELSLQNEIAKNQIPVTAAQKEFAEAQKNLNTLSMLQHDTQQGGIRAQVEAAMRGRDVDPVLRAQYEADKASGNVDYSKIGAAMNLANATQAVESLKNKLGDRDKAGSDTDRLNKANAVIDQPGADGTTIRQTIAALDAVIAKRAAEGASPEELGSFKVERRKIGGDKVDAVQLAQAAVDADNKAIQQAETNLAIAKETEAYNKKLNDELGKLADEVSAALQKLNATQAEAGIKSGAATTVAHLEAQTANLDLEQQMQKQFIELAEATGKTKQQTVNIIRQIVAGERDTADTLAQLQVQYAQVKSSADLH